MTVGLLTAAYFSLALNFLFVTHYVAERMQDEWFSDLCSLGGLAAYWICVVMTFQYGMIWFMGDMQ